MKQNQKADRLSFLSKLRQALQNGVGRCFVCNLLPIALSIALCVYLMYFDANNGNFFLNHWPNFPDIMKALSAITAALSLMSYNLRNKALDYFQKLISSKTIVIENIKDELEEAKCAGIRISNLTLKSFFTMLCLGIFAYFISEKNIWTCIWLSFCTGLLLSCIFSYFFVIFRLEYIEAKFLDLVAIHEEISRQDEDIKHLHENQKNEKDTEFPPGW